MASLHEPKSTGGNNAREGFEYQDAYAIYKLIDWIESPTFDHFISESLGDIEICYFSLDSEEHREFIEAKSNQLSKKDLNEEINRFKDIFNNKTNRTSNFKLVCNDYLEEIKPFINLLDRKKSHGSSYGETSQEYTDICTELRSKASTIGLVEVDFVLEHVSFEIFQMDLENSADKLRSNLSKILEQATGKEISTITDLLINKVFASSKKTIGKKELEEVIAANLKDNTEFKNSSIPLQIKESIHRSSQPSFSLDIFIEPHFSSARSTLSEEYWANLKNKLTKIASFVEKKSIKKTIKISGSPSMSNAFLVGWAFRSVLGFNVIAVDKKMGEFDSRFHPPNIAFNTVFIPWSTSLPFKGESAILIKTDANDSSSILKDISNSLPHELPINQLHSQTGLTGIEDLNKLVTDTKNVLSDCSKEKLHLYIKGPWFFAFFLGYRSNTLHNIQLYDYIAGKYVKTVLIP